MIEGITGETAIFKRRGDAPSTFHTGSKPKPKELTFVMDVSGRLVSFRRSFWGGGLTLPAH